MNIKTVTIIGANGTMGSNVSAIFASFGNAKVYMVSRRLEDAEKAKQKAALSVKAEAVADNLIPKTYENLAECVSSSDLVFESVFEDFELKSSIYAKILPFLKPTTIIGTGSSGLSITALSKNFTPEIRKNFMGIHMYNPPYNMILCEVIPSDVTDREVLKQVKTYLSEVLLRKVVEVRDAPAFLGNRIGFQFINEALQYAEKYKDNGGIDYIDSILGPFTGRSMAPLATSDFVGLDVHKAIVDNLFDNTNDYAHETFKFPGYAHKLVADGKLGRKTGGGLYKAISGSDGKKTIYVYDIVTGDYRPKEKYIFPFAKQMIHELKEGNYQQAFSYLVENHSIEAEICLDFLLKYAIYGIAMAKELGDGVTSADDVMATGYNWVPPLAVVEALGGITEVRNLIEGRFAELGIGRQQLDLALSDLPKSNYDYRPFFKAK